MHTGHVMQVRSLRAAQLQNRLLSCVGVHALARIDTSEPRVTIAHAGSNVFKALKSGRLRRPRSSLLTPWHPTWRLTAGVRTVCKKVLVNDLTMNQNGKQRIRRTSALAQTLVQDVFGMPRPQRAVVGHLVYSLWRRATSRVGSGGKDV